MIDAQGYLLVYKNARLSSMNISIEIFYFHNPKFSYLFLTFRIFFFIICVNLLGLNHTLPIEIDIDLEQLLNTDLEQRKPQSGVIRGQPKHIGNERSLNTALLDHIGKTLLDNLDHLRLTRRRYPKEIINERVSHRVEQLAVDEIGRCWLVHQRKQRLDEHRERLVDVARVGAVQVDEELGEEAEHVRLARVVRRPFDLVQERVDYVVLEEIGREKAHVLPQLLE